MTTTATTTAELGFAYGRPQNPAPTPNPRQDFKNVLQTMSQDCKDALKKYLGQVSKAADSVGLFDVDGIQGGKASKYWGAGYKVTLGAAFDKGRKPGAVYTFPGGYPKPDIYFRGSENSFAGEGGVKSRPTGTDELSRMPHNGLRPPAQR